VQHSPNTGILYARRAGAAENTTAMSGLPEGNPVRVLRRRPGRADRKRRGQRKGQRKPADWRRPTPRDDQRCCFFLPVMDY
jgi:hypothetical protein